MASSTPSLPPGEGAGGGTTSGFWILPLRDRGSRALLLLFIVFVAAYASALWHYERIRPVRPKKIHLLGAPVRALHLFNPFPR